jgi:hypothetical protein
MNEPATKGPPDVKVNAVPDIVPVPVTAAENTALDVDTVQYPASVPDTAKFEPPVNVKLKGSYL